VSFFLLIIALTGLSFAQPLASPKQMGMDVRYFVGFESGIQINNSDFKSSLKVEIPEGRRGLIPSGVWESPELKSSLGYNFSLGSMVNGSHEISLAYSRYTHEFKLPDGNENFIENHFQVAYRFLFFEREGLKPLVGLGYSSSTMVMENTYRIDANQALDSKGGSKNLMLMVGGGWYDRYFSIGLEAQMMYQSYNRFSVEDDYFRLSPGVHNKAIRLSAWVRVYFWQ
jgi:hypothetical protein